MVMSLALERQLVLIAVAMLMIATIVQFAGLVSGRAAYRPTAALYAGVVLLLGAAIAGRWMRENQGPFLTLYDILLSGVFSLTLMYLLISVTLPAVRGGSLVTSPLLLILGVWLTGVSELAVPLPGAFRTPWLWAHVLSGKLFLGFCLAAAATASVMLIRGAALGEWSSRLTPFPEQSEKMIWVLFFAAFICHSVMLVAGAVWAHSAWGHYWSWDPLETWTLVTWLMLGGTLHARATFRNMPQGLGHVLALATFAVAFLTFFGVPFFSIAPHKGLM
ncbi:MAG: cytochrome c biogenesis protein CcsA [Gammaproteobacteria bacterium]|nr:cytochrome c biogenesis protein CcsA [Gammaproteobacteria bacterium]